jgi:aryl-alcohol dehydrogenase-like predicted oxidoreductase
LEYRNVGKSGLLVSLAGLGCNNIGNRIDDAASREIVHRALDLGITLFDTADMYGKGGESEKVLGRLLQDRRKDVVIATKFGKDEAHKSKGASRRYIVQAIEASLRRLNTDWIDLYQIHAPDPLTSIEETMRALDDLIRGGKVRYIGCSNFAPWQVVEAQLIAKQLNLNPFVSCQNEYSLLVREVETELVPAMLAYGLGLLPFFPLASGLLSGKYASAVSMPAGSRLSKLKHLASRFMTESNMELVAQLTAFGEKYGRSLLEVSLGWLASRPVVPSIIAGSSTTEQLVQNVHAIECRFSLEEQAELQRHLTLRNS